MKARVKATGEIKEVTRGIYSPYQYVDNEGMIYTENDIEELPGDDGAIFFDPTIDYWTRLEHQYAGQFMQAMISSSNYIDVSEEAMADASFRMAHALVEKYKKEE